MFLKRFFPTLPRLLNRKLTMTPSNSARDPLSSKTPQGRLTPKDGKDEKTPNGANKQTGETGGPSGPEPTRYGDWERKGRVSDF
jgi:hypothetical protein